MKTFWLAFLIVISGILTSCQNKSVVPDSSTITPPAVDPVVVAPPEVKPQPVATENPVKGWIPEYDTLVKSLVTNDMLNVPNSRMTRFCDVWPALTKEDRKQFYADLIYSIAGPESAWNNLTGMVEDTMGKDALTKKYPVVSEGMLQLSYQDSLWYGPACKWDWPADEQKLVRDLQLNGQIRTKGSFKSQAMDRSTLDPIRNITCGMSIIDFHIKRTNREFADALGEYWYVMKRRNASSYSQVWKNLKSRNTKCK